MRHLIVTTITILIALSGISQTTTADSTRLPNYQLIGAIKDIEKGKIIIQERDVLIKKVDSLVKLKTIQDSTINLFKDRDRLYKQLVVNYQATEKNQQEQIQKYFDLYSQSQKDLRKQKRKTFWSRVGMLVLPVGVYLLKSK